MIILSKKLKRYLPKERPYSEIEAAFDAVLRFRSKKKLTDKYIESKWSWNLKQAMYRRKVQIILTSAMLSRTDEGVIYELKNENLLVTKNGRLLSGKRLETFNQFWKAYDYPQGKAEAADAWLNIPIMTNKLVDKIINAASREAQRRPELIRKNRTPIMAQGWLTGKRWEDEIYLQQTVDQTQRKSLTKEQIKELNE